MSAPLEPEIAFAGKAMLIFALIPAFFAIIPAAMGLPPDLMFLVYPGVAGAVACGGIGVGILRRSPIAAWAGLALFGLMGIGVAVGIFLDPSIAVGAGVFWGILAFVLGRKIWAALEVMRAPGG